MKIKLALSLLLLTGCASQPFNVTLYRMSAASSITELYSVDQTGVATKLVKVPFDAGSKQWKRSVDSKLFAQLRGLVTDSIEAISKINLLDSGNITSGIIVDMEKSHKEITWSNIDPPKMHSPVFDSLYSVMMRVELSMISQ